MSLLTAGIQIAEIDHIQIYMAGGKPLPVIKAETGADYIINGTLYNMTTGAVNCHLRADGNTIAKPDYKVSGYSWNTGSDISIDVLPNESMQNYIACTPLVISGVPIASLTYDPGQGGSRARSAIGIKDSRLMLYCNTSGKTPEQLRDDLYKAGWRSAVMLDGGGSTQCDFDGQTITSSRKVSHYILVYLRKAKQEPPTGTMTTGKAGLDLIKSFEGLRLTAYKAVPTEVWWTIGYGHYAPEVKKGQVITEAKAEAYLRQDLATAEKAVNGLNKKLTQNQFDALVSFAFNCGAGSLNTLCKNRALPQIADAMLLYNKAGGNVLAGLTRRRNAERDLFLSGAEIAPAASSGTHAVSASGGLRMRAQASTSADTLLTIPDGTKVTPIRFWAEVEYNGRRGYVAADYLKEV